MAKITTEDCKNYLNKIFVNNKENEWKRVKKYKSNEGWIRIFSHPDFEDKLILENNNNELSIVNNKLNLNSNKKEIFDLRVFSHEEIVSAWDTYKKYYDPNAENANDYFLEKNKKSIVSIPGILHWCMTDDTYENTVENTEDMSWDFNMKGFNIFMFDKQGFHEYAGDEYLLNKNLPNYFNKCDEYHYEIEKDISLRDLVRDLSSLGYSYNNKNLPCLVKKLMKNVIFNEVPFIISDLENIILNDDIDSLRKYSNEQLNNEKIGLQNIVLFALDNNKYKSFDYLADQKIKISEYDLKDFISYKNIENIKNNSSNFNKLIDLILSNENISLNSDSLSYIIRFLDDNKNKENLLLLFNKFNNNENILKFTSSNILLKENSILNSFITRFKKHDEELSSWIDGSLYYNDDMIVLKNKEMREALTRDLVSSVISKRYEEKLERLKHYDNPNRLMMVMISHDGTRETDSERENKSYVELIKRKNVILSYFDIIDDDNNLPKKKYPTKF